MFCVVLLHTSYTENGCANTFDGILEGTHVVENGEVFLETTGTTPPLFFLYCNLFSCFYVRQWPQFSMSTCRTDLHFVTGDKGKIVRGWFCWAAMGYLLLFFLAACVVFALSSSFFNRAIACSCKHLFLHSLGGCCQARPSGKNEALY